MIHAFPASLTPAAPQQRQRSARDGSEETFPQVFRPR